MTASFDHSLGTPPLADAIDRHPLVVAPETRLIDVVALMYATAQSSRQALAETSKILPPQSIDALSGARSSCVLVMQNEQLLGIFTERDLVKLTAAGVSVHTTEIRDVMHHPVLTMSEQALHHVFAALFLFRRHRIRHLAIADEQQRLIGVVSLDSIRHILRPTNLLKIRRVSEVMTSQVTTATPHTSVAELTKRMATHQISCVVIVEAVEARSNNAISTEVLSFPQTLSHPVGIVTERDIVRFQALGLDIDATLAETVMSTPLFILSPEDSLWTAHQEMERRQVRRLVVSWNWGEKLGIVTQTSILRVFDPIEMHDVIETLQRTIQQLGLDLDKVLTKAIDHDTHLTDALQTSDESEIPNIKTYLDTLQTQIEHLCHHPELPVDTRQATLQGILSDIQQFQSLL
ncbi:MAG: CBS domain-containing protein [Oscillatoriophycideae cyanobacterium NC_groundwater_1537_Pr4_S-0.65um_50_18]|nr:CBS domain-containing protein [Oscillatoriophycideae cyanobacterium NC_groundwater_1537_Pr4_S-0.65um_50_18]